MAMLQETFKRQWHDVVHLVLGLWLIASPWLLGYVATTAAFYNAIALGVIIAVVAVAALVAFHAWEEWAMGVLGLWLIVSPWLLGFTAVTAALANQIIVGLIVTALAFWTAYEAQQGRMAANH